MITGQLVDESITFLTVGHLMIEPLNDKSHTYQSRFKQ